MAPTDPAKTASYGILDPLIRYGYLAAARAEGQVEVLALKPLEAVAEAIKDLHASEPAQEWHLSQVLTGQLERQQGGLFGVRPSRWLFFVNPASGTFKTQETAEWVRQRAGEGSMQVTLLPTHKDTDQRVRELAQQVQRHGATHRDPVGIVAFGGDGTLNNAVSGVMTYLFGSPTRFAETAPERAVEKLLQSGLVLGAVQGGGANDAGLLHHLPKVDEPERILDYLKDSIFMPLNLGAVFLDGRREAHLFTHSASGGHTIASVYRDTTELRGMAARRARRALGFKRVMIHPNPVTVSWTGDGGDHRSQRVLEVLSMAVLRADGWNCFPGAPQPGIGVTVFPYAGRRSIVPRFLEIFLRGALGRMGFSSFLTPSGLALRTLPRDLQLSLQVGEEMDFDYAQQVPVQVSGDYLASASRIRMKALPPFPKFMSVRGSNMDDITVRARRSLSGPRGRGLPSPEGPKALLGMPGSSLQSVLGLGAFPLLRAL